MKRATKVIAGLALLGLGYLALWPVSIDPQSWDAPIDKGYVEAFAPNTELANLEQLSIGKVHGPEDVVLHEGQIFVSSQEGKIIKIDPIAKTYKTFADTQGSALGMEMDAQGNLIIADAFRGLLSVDSCGVVTVLSDEVAGTPILYADDLDIADDGTIYFSDASTKFGANSTGETLSASLLEIMEHGGTGRVLAYNPANQTTRIIREGYVFSNGVALTQDGHILVNETGTYQVHKISPDGSSHVIMENLPGFPDNINRGPKLSDGRESFLIGIVSQRSKWLDDNARKPFARKVAMRLPAFMRPQAVSYGLIVQIDGDGNIIKTWQDPSGAYPSATGAVIAEDGYMYVSSLTAPYLGRVKLN